MAQDEDDELAWNSVFGSVWLREGNLWKLGIIHKKKYVGE